MTLSKMKSAASICISVLMIWIAGATAWAGNLDMGGLAGFDYSGKDSLNGNSTCRLSVSAIGKDFSGRLYQDFRIWVDGRPDLNFNLRLRGADRTRAPDRIVEGHPQFNIGLDGNELQLLTDAGDALQIVQFNLADTTGVSGNKNVFIRCVNVIRKGR